MNDPYVPQELLNRHANHLRILSRRRHSMDPEAMARELEDIPAGLRVLARDPTLASQRTALFGAASSVQECRDRMLRLRGVASPNDQQLDDAWKPLEYAVILTYRALRGATAPTKKPRLIRRWLHRAAAAIGILGALGGSPSRRDAPAAAPPATVAVDTTTRQATRDTTKQQPAKDTIAQTPPRDRKGPAWFPTPSREQIQTMSIAARRALFLPFVEHASRVYGVDAEESDRMITQESQWDPYAVNGDHYGLGQMHAGNWVDYQEWLREPEDLFDAIRAIYAMAAHRGMLKRIFLSYEEGKYLAVLSYNGGQGTVLNVLEYGAQQGIEPRRASRTEIRWMLQHAPRTILSSARRSEMEHYVDTVFRESSRDYAAAVSQAAIAPAGQYGTD